jgi:hypothetical protein
MMRPETLNYDDRFTADKVHVCLWARGRLFQLAPFAFSDEDFSPEGRLFKQFATDLGQKVGIGLSKEDTDGIQGNQKKSTKECYIQKLWSTSAKEIRHTLTQRRSAVGSMIRKSYIGTYTLFREYST